jgi:hypothetical protein
MPNFSGIWTVTQQMQAIGQSIWPAVPGAPTIGTATATGDTTATVAFTAGSTGYPSTVTFTATSSPGGLTGTGTSPITVTGLTAVTAYTFTVTATNATGTSPASAASNSITTLPAAIGAAFGGGFFAGQISTAGNGVADYNLVVGPVASAQNTSKQYKNANTATAGADSVIDGPQNTADIVADGNSTVYPAGHFCNNLVIGGFSDWYMPAKNELEVCYYNLKPTTQNNITSSGINANAVPARASNYTSGNPAQTTSAAFKSTGAEDFTNANTYWSSTENSASEAWSAYFGNGSQGISTKDDSKYVRAIRRVAV